LESTAVPGGVIADFPQAPAGENRAGGAARLLGGQGNTDSDIIGNCSELWLALLTLGSNLP